MWLAAATAAVFAAGAFPQPGPQRTRALDLGAEASVRLDGAAVDDRAGISVSGAGDVDGDGRPDLVVGAEGADHNGRPNSGSAYVVFAKVLTRTIDLAAVADAGFRIDGALAGDRAGSVVASAGDVNGDGRADVLLGAELAEGTGLTNSGSAYVVFGKSSSEPIDLGSLGEDGFRIDGAAVEDRAGGALAGAGDLNGDGLADVVVGAARADGENRRDSGSAFVVFGKATTEPVDLASLGPAGFRIDGASAGDRAGIAVAAAGDVNGDGRTDLVVGADGSDRGGASAGSTYVVFGAPAAEDVDLGTLATRGFRIDGSAAMLSGSSVAGAGDVNGDGRADVVVGSPGFELFSGLAHVVFGGASTDTISLASLGGRGFRIDGATVGDRLGAAAAGVGDVNADGRADVLVAADGDDLNGRTDSGSAYLVLGRATTATVDLSGLEASGLRVDGAAAGDRAAFSIASAGDLDGDGRNELALGAPRADGNARIDSGSAYLVTLDLQPPGLALRGPARQRVLAQRGIVVTASCDEPCRLSANGALTTLRTGARVRLGAAHAGLARAGARTLKLRLGPQARRRLSRMLASGSRARAAVVVRAVDRAGNTSLARRTIVVLR